MSKRLFDTDCPSPNIVIISTDSISGSKNDPSLPPKKPKLAGTSTPVIPKDIKVESDTIQVPPTPKELPQSEIVIKSENPIKKEVHSVITVKNNLILKCEPNVANKSPETQAKVMKTPTKKSSWASNYLKSIGLEYKKPIKVNISSIKKKLHEEFEVLNKSNSTGEEDISKEIKDENPNKFPVQSDNDMGILMNNPCNEEVTEHHSNINPQPYFQLNQPQMLQINENPHFELNHPAVLQINENPHFELNQPATLPINEIPHFEINHPEMIQINGIPPTFCGNFHNNESLYTHPATFTEYDYWSRKSILHRPPEDKSYLDKVDQFLRENSTKISQDRSHSQEYRTRFDTSRTRSLSLKNRDVVYSEKPQKICTSTKNLDKTQLHDGTKQPKEDIKKSCDPERDVSRQPNRSKSTEKYSNVPSTSKQNSHDDEKQQKKTENIRRLEFIAKYNKLVQEFTRTEIEDNIRSRLDYSRTGATGFTPKTTKKTYYKTKESSDSSSSEFVLNKSYQHIKTQSSKRQTKRKRSSGSSCSENSRGGLKRHRYKIIQHEKNITKRDGSDSSSDSNSCSMPCCARNIKVSKKRKSRDRCKSSSNSERRRSTECALKSQLPDESCRGGSPSPIKKHKSRRDIFNSREAGMLSQTQKPRDNNKQKSIRERPNSRSNSAIRKQRSPKRGQKSKLPKESCRRGSPSKKPKQRRDRSNSHRSEKCEAELLCQTKKTKNKRKQKSRRESSNSSSNSETCVHKLPCKGNIPEKKKRKRSNSRINSEKSKSPNAHKYRGNSEQREKSKISKSGDRKQARKLIKDVTARDKTKTIVINPSSTGYDKKAKETGEKEKKIKSVADSKKTESEYATRYTFNIPDHKTDESAAIKSVVRIKDRRKSHHNTHEMENFDLRSKLSRKGLSQYFSKICKNNNKPESKTRERENLVITVANQDEDIEQLTIANQDETKQKRIKTATDKLLEITQKQHDTSKTKKLKKIKLVINVICESSKSGDSDDGGDMTCNKPDKECKDESIIMQKVITENNLSNELSFLDDLNIDEIVDSLMRDKNESCPLKDTTDTAIVLESSSSPEIVDTYDLVSDSEHSVSDASTVHLEELREMHNNLNTTENNNKNPQSLRIVNVVNNFETGDTNIDATIKLEKSGCEQIAMMCEKEIKQEIPHEEKKGSTSFSTDERMELNNNESVTNEVTANRTKYSQECDDNTSEVVVKKEPVYNAMDECSKILGIKSKEHEPLLESKTEIVKEIDVNSPNTNVIPIHKIKEELVDKDNEEARIINHIETDLNLVSINANVEKSGTVQDDKVKSAEKKETERNSQDVNQSRGSQVIADLENKLKENTTVTGCTLYLNLAEPDLPLIPPNEIKDGMRNDVPNVTSILTQIKVGSCGKNVVIEKIPTKCTSIQTNEVNVSDVIDLTKELNDVKEEPNTDTENTDKCTVAVLSPFLKVSEKTINEVRENKENKHDGHIQSNITEIESKKEESKNKILGTKTTKKHDQIVKSTDAIQLQKNSKLKEINVLQVPSKIPDNGKKFKSSTDSQHKLYENREPTKAKNEIPQIKVNNPQKGNVTSARLQIDSGKNEVYDKPNKDSSQLNNIVSKSDNKISKHQEKPKPTSNVAQKDNLQQKDSASGSFKIQIESGNEVSKKRNSNSSQNKKIVSNSDDHDQPKPTPTVVKKINLQEKDTASDNLKLQTESGNKEVDYKPNKDSSQNKNIVFNSDKKICKDNEQPKPTPTVVKKVNLQEKVTASDSLILQIVSGNKEVDDKPNKDSSQNNNVSYSDKKISEDHEQPKITPTVVKKVNLQEKVPASYSLKLQIANGNKEVDDKPNKDSSQNNNVSDSNKKISDDHEQNKPTPTVVIKVNLQEKVIASDSLKLQIESGNKEDDDKPNKDSSQNKNIVTNSDKKISKDPNVVKKNNLLEKDTPAKPRSHSPIRVKTRLTDSAKNSEELTAKPETVMIAKLEERLANYLHEPYTVDSILHWGRFSKIYKCRDSKGQNYVAKMISYRNAVNRYIRGISKEKMLVSLQKDIPEENLNFVRIINGLEVSGQWCFLMEYCPKNLNKVLQENKKSFNINTVQLLSRQLVTALTVLRHHNVVHADIKPEHILLNNKEDRLKLGGFDCAFYYTDKPQGLPNIGTVNYRAPETILGYNADYSIDVWAAALVMYEMSTRRKLFPGHYNNDILFKQMCTRGFIPPDMISQSRYAHQHFQGTSFLRRVGPKGQKTVFCSEGQLFRNNILDATIKSTYFKEWGMNIPKHQKRTETGMTVSFCQLLEQMLIVHPQFRLTIENVYTHPFLFDYYD